MIRLPEHIAAAVRRGGTVVVPSRQRAYAARLAYAAAEIAGGRSAWSSADIMTLEAWVGRETEQLAAASGYRLPRTLHPAEEWMLWREATAQATQDLSLLDPGAVAQSLQRAAALAVNYEINVDNPYGAEAQLLDRVRRAVTERSQAVNAALLSALAQKLSAPEADVECAGFLQLTPRLRTLGLTQRTPAVQGARPQGVLAADEWDELQRIATWCAACVDVQPDARLLVIYPGSPGARERLATLVRQALDPHSWIAGTQSTQLVAIEGGQPLAAVPVVGHALFSLRWLSGYAGEFSDLSDWLRAPYWQTPDAGARARIDLWFRELRFTSERSSAWLAQLDQAPSPVAHAAQDLSRQFKAAAAALGAGLATPREWSERFGSALEDLHWPGERVRGSAEQQNVGRFFELLDEFGQLVAAHWRMPLSDAVELLRELARATAFRPADDDATVTISAALADPVVLYDGIWVAGLHADAFPQPVQPDPFIPLREQVAAEIPAASAGGRHAEAVSLLTAWRAATGNLVLSAPARSGDLDLLPSPLWVQWLAAPGGSTAILWLPERLHRPRQTETVLDTTGLLWPLETVLPAGTRTVELQNLCGFRAYAELRLGSTELGAAEPGVAPDVRGRLLHCALELLWAELQDSRGLAAQDDPSLQALIERSVDCASAQVLGADDARPPLLIRECRRAVRLIRELCTLERSRAPFRVAGIEKPGALQVGGATMTIRIDRIDALESGGRVILDYKSGKRGPADWYGDRPSHPQLLAYLAAVGTDVQAMATVNVTAREVRFDGIAASASLLPSVRGVQATADGSGDAWQIWTDAWRARIGQLAADFIAGRADIDPRPGACQFCQASSVCRIADRGLGTPEVDPDE